jgi:hypothetical protein
MTYCSGYLWGVASFEGVVDLQTRDKRPYRKMLSGDGRVFYLFQIERYGEKILPEVKTGVKYQFEYREYSKICVINTRIFAEAKDVQRITN